MNRLDGIQKCHICRHYMSSPYAELFNHFRGDKIECPMRMYRAEYIADLANRTTDRRERAKIARAGGYSLKFIEGILSKRKNENEDNLTREEAEKALKEREQK